MTGNLSLDSSWFWSRLVQGERTPLWFLFGQDFDEQKKGKETHECPSVSFSSASSSAGSSDSSSAYLFRFLSVSSLNSDDRNSSLSAVGEEDDQDDLMVGPNNEGLSISWFLVVKDSKRLEAKNDSSVSSLGTTLEEVSCWVSKAVYGCREVLQLVWSGLSHLMYEFRSKLVTALIPLYSMAAIS